jgi:hypothetical protein
VTEFLTALQKFLLIALTVGLIVFFLWRIHVTEKKNAALQWKLSKREEKVAELKREVSELKHWDDQDIATHLYKDVEDFSATRNLNHLPIPLVLDTKTRRFPRS